MADILRGLATAACGGLLVLLAGCGGGGGAPEDPRAQALTTAGGVAGLARVAQEPAGANCAAGGNRITAWLDANGNGTPDEGEGATVGYVCDGARGTAGAASRVITAAEAPGATCAAGGTRLSAGLDGNGNGVLDAAEITSTSIVCNGVAGAPAAAAPLLAVTAEPAGATCPAGGSRLSAGADSNGNGVLDAGEVASASIVCNGAAGSAGPRSLVSVAAEPAGAHCARGGTVIATGLDSDGDGLLGAAEVTSTRHLCNGDTGATGAPGAGGASGRHSLLNATSEAPGAQCTSGGTRFSVGSDANGNGLLDDAEVTATRYVCNGTGGSSGLGSLLRVSEEGAGANCVAGGSRIDSGLDLNANGVLDAAEVSATAYACSGAAGAAGAAGSNGLVSRVAVVAEAPGANCAAGGNRITAGLDANGNGTLDAEEVSSTGYACNGASGAAGGTGASGSISLIDVTGEPAGANCAAGGTKLRAGIDGNGNGQLDGAEATSTAYVCNGSDGAGLGWTALSAGPVQAQPNQGYVAQSTQHPLVVTLPPNPSAGDVVRVVGAGDGGWRIAQNDAQFVDTSRLGDAAVSIDSVGANWEPRPAFMGRQAYDLATSADGRVILMAANDTEHFLSTDGGLTAVALSARIVPGGFPARGAAVSADGTRLMLVGGNAIRSSADGGLNWTSRTLGTELWAAAMSGDGRLRLVADRGAAGSAGGRLWLSEDYGVTWTPQGPTAPWRRLTTSADGLRLVAVAYDDGLDQATLVTSADGGSTWTPRGTGQVWFDVASSSDGMRLVAAAIGGQLYTSTDAGVTWTARESARTWKAVASSADGRKLLAISKPVGSGNVGGLWVSLDAGVTWSSGSTAFAFGTFADPYGMAVLADGSKMFATNSAGLGLIVSTAAPYARATTTGTSGALSGDQYTAADLQYVGSGRWLVIGHLGTLFVQ